MLPDRGSLTVEFKSEQRRPQSDDEIVVTSLPSRTHKAARSTSGSKITALSPASPSSIPISMDSRPSYSTKPYRSRPTRIESFHEHGCQVVAIEVDNSQQIVSTSSGKTLQRRLKADGTPEVVPLFVSQFISRLSQQRSYDYSGMPSPGGALADLDSEARNRLRQRIRETNANNSLLTFDDMDSDRTLGLVSGNKGEELPTIAGLLTIGTTESIKRCVPTASATFQVMEGTTPRVNTDPSVLPLVDMFDKINDLMQPKSIVV